MSTENFKLDPIIFSGFYRILQVFEVWNTKKEEGVVQNFFEEYIKSIINVCDMQSVLVKEACIYHNDVLQCRHTWFENQI